MSARSQLGRFLRGGRTSLLAALNATGVANAVANSRWRRQRLLILCYHGISLRDEHEWDPELFVTPEFLRRRLQMLRDQRCNVLELGDAVEKLRSGNLPERSVALTFDDGFYNFAAAAVPLLEEFGFPATVYVSTYHCVNQRPLLALSVRYLLWRARDRAGHSNLRDAAARDARAQSLLSEASALAPDRDAQLAWLAHFASTLGEDWGGFLRERRLHLMTVAELTDVSRRGFDVQLHTHRHRTPRDVEAFRAEILQNRQILEAATQRPATHFCYPSGDHDAMFLPILRDLGIKSATIGDPRLATAHDEPLLLPRFIDTLFQPETVYRSWLAGPAALLSRHAPRVHVAG